MWERLRGEEGMTLTELLIATAIVGIVLVGLFGLLGRMQVGIAHAGERGQADRKAQLALEQLNREIRSGSVLVDPAAENDPAQDMSPGMTLRVFTLASSGARCVQWRITSGQELQRRDWSAMGGGVSAWKVMAEHVVNRTLSPSEPAFALAGSAASGDYGNRAVNIDLVLAGGGSSGDSVRVHGSATGRNARFGNTNNACSTVPAF
jgi:prepilin-type N-terminal cleavage/methylation domain-containing protein